MSKDAKGLELSSAEIAAVWDAEAEAAGFGPEALPRLRSAPPHPQLHPPCPEPDEYLVLVDDDNEPGQNKTITIAAPGCPVASIGGADTLFATAPTLAEAIRAGESARVAYGIPEGVTVCDCAEPKRTNGAGGAFPDNTWYLEDRPCQSTTYVRWVVDDTRLADAVREAHPAAAVLTSAGPISPHGELLEPGVGADREKHGWIIEAGVPEWR